MAIMIPKINPNLITNRGEQIFYKAASKLPDAYTVYYSYDYITDGKSYDHMAYYEADFIITHQWLGYLVVEVKCGYYRYYNNIWQKRLGEVFVDIDKDPVEQAKRAMYFIVERYKEVTKTDMFPLRIRYAVCFPDCEVFEGLAPAHLREDSIWLGADLKKLDRNIKAVFGGQAAEANGKAIDILKKKILAPAFTVHTDLESEIRIFSKKSGKVMTDEQKRILDETELDQRKIYLGAAGTGKTFIAIEKVRRLVADGKKVLMTCFNRDLGNYLRHAFKDELASGYLTVTNFHDYLFKLLETKDIEVVVPELQEEKMTFFEKGLLDLAMDIIDELSEEEKFDALVVDEGQDFREDWYLFLLEMLNSSQSGEFYIFADPSQNLFNADLSALSSFQVSYHRLTRNLRNTEKINNWLSELIGTEPLYCVHEGGESVAFFSWEDAAHELSLVEQELGRLVSKRVSPGRVVILSPNRLEKSSLSGLKQIGQWPLFDLIKGREEGLAKPPDAVAFSTIRSFKGLEADIVFFIGIRAGTRACTINDIYVGSSRASFLLYVFHEEGFDFNGKEQTCVKN